MNRPDRFDEEAQKHLDAWDGYLDMGHKKALAEWGRRLDAEARAQTWEAAAKIARSCDHAETVNELLLDMAASCRRKS